MSRWLGDPSVPAGASAASACVVVVARVVRAIGMTGCGDASCSFQLQVPGAVWSRPRTDQRAVHPSARSRPNWNRAHDLTHVSAPSLRHHALVPPVGRHEVASDDVRRYKGSDGSALRNSAALASMANVCLAISGVHPTLMRYVVVTSHCGHAGHACSRGTR